MSHLQRFLTTMGRLARDPGTAGLMVALGLAFVFAAAWGVTRPLAWYVPVRINSWLVDNAVFIIAALAPVVVWKFGRTVWRGLIDRDFSPPWEMSLGIATVASSTFVLRTWGAIARTLDQLGWNVEWMRDDPVIVAGYAIQAIGLAVHVHAAIRADEEAHGLAWPAMTALVLVLVYAGATAPF